jgi:uncharacterized membrane protein
MYPKARIDALTDGLFAVAMTILVLDLHEALSGGNGGLPAALTELWGKFFPYAISFYMLGSIWLSNIRLGTRTEYVDRRYVTWWLLYLLIATCLPFSTSVIGRFAAQPAAVSLYSLNMVALALVGYRLVVLLAEHSDDRYTLIRKLALSALIASALLSLALSAVSSRAALWAYALNALQPRFARWFLARRGITATEA